ncbi:MAG TPA: hypothetical protein PLW02_12105, partial [Verrucomicrobiota bacterium]|nr:hypothetical protein [Verrucomicrobiota bacterium]
STKIAQGVFIADDSQDNTIDWWKAIIPAQASGTIKYKIGLFKSSVSVISDADFAKLYGLTQFSVKDFNPLSALIWLHNDLNTNSTRTGLQEGFHIVRARAFLPRDGKSSVFNTFVQTFYYDAAPPQGVIAYPQNNGETFASREYGVVIRADSTTTFVEYNIQDNDPNNDDINTGVLNGNGLSNNIPIFVAANAVNPSEFLSQQFPDLPKEFRFNYVGIPSSGSATITVRIYEATSSVLSNRVQELKRTVLVAAPPQNLFIAFPSKNNETATLDRNDKYTVVARFSNVLRANVTNFSIYINGSLQPRYSADGTPLYYFDDQFGGDEMNELRYDWKGMNEGENLIEILYNDGEVALQSSRIIYIKFTSPAVSIVAPPYVDANGAHPYSIVLPLKSNASPEEKSFKILVETVVDITNVFISFSPANQNFPDGLASLDTSFQSSAARRWFFLWTNMVDGLFTITATAYSSQILTATQEVRVVFKPIDTDGDNLPDDWEIANYLDASDATGQNGASG